MGLHVFVTRELFPFTAGGIGPVIGNILEIQSPEEARQTAIVYLGGDLDPVRFALAYPGVVLVSAPEESYEEHDGIYCFPPVKSYATTPLHAESVRAMQALKRLEFDHGKLSYVEFTDWGGAAFATCQEKKLGLAFQETTVAVRLHSADSLLCAVEARLIDSHAIGLYDIERKALADCDLIVGQLASVAEVTRTFFDFDASEWSKKLRIHAPPVSIDGAPVQPHSIVPSNETSIVFSSKIQRFKRPDVFARGVCGFLRKMPGFTGRVIFLAHSFDDTYLALIERLIPADLKHRFSFINKASNAERQKIIANSVCVFPSVFESFCLAAYEASLNGAICLLNGTNPAFTDATPWTDGDNCRKFDGSVDDMVRALFAIFDAPHALSVVALPEDRKPWEGLPEAVPFKSTRMPVVSVLITNFNLGQYLAQALDSVLSSDYPNVQVVLVDDASTDELSQAIIEKLGNVEDERFVVVKRPHNAGLAAARNLALQSATGDYVLPLDADDLVHPSFISLAVQGLECNPEYDFVVPQTASFTDATASTVMSSGSSACAVFVGEARASGLWNNRFSTATIFARRDVLANLKYNEELGAYEDWDLYQRAVMARRRFLVTNSLQFYYRHRTDSMNHNPVKQSLESYYLNDLMRAKSLEFGNIRLPGYTLSGSTQVLMERAQGVRARAQDERIAILEAQLHEFASSEVVFAALRVAHSLNARAPWALKLGKYVTRKIWHARQYIRGGRSA